ncbi:MAG: hypothetical protein HFI67_01170 [Lachnospiraceae bacterium]|nr:hypothetical protein [Lachnospiraceae bacterium]
MIALNIPEKKDFTSKLFLQNTFDSFLVSQASFTTGTSLSIDGRLHRDYFTDAEWEAMEQHDLVRWSMLKPLCFQIIRGNRLPEQFKIVFILSHANTQKLLADSRLSFSPEQVGGLFLNIHYEQSSLTCTTGISFTSFLMDKTLEHTWDDMVKRFLKTREILFEEL